MPAKPAPVLAPHVRAAQDALAHVAACLPLDFPEVRGAVHTCEALLGALVHHGVTEAPLAHAWACLDRAALGAGEYQPSPLAQGQLREWLAQASRRELVTALVRAARDANASPLPVHPHAEAAYHRPATPGNAMPDTITSSSSPKREPEAVLAEVLALLPERFPARNPTPEALSGLLRELGARGACILWVYRALHLAAFGSPRSPRFDSLTLWLGRAQRGEVATLLREAREALEYAPGEGSPTSTREALSYVARRLPVRFPTSSGTCAPDEAHFSEEDVFWVLREVRTPPRLVAEVLVHFYELRAREGREESMQAWLSRVGREEALATFTRAAS